LPDHDKALDVASVPRVFCPARASSLFQTSPAQSVVQSSVTLTGAATCGVSATTTSARAQVRPDRTRAFQRAARLARQGVKVVVHDALVASDHDLIDDRTLAPEPSYWDALLWRRPMCTTVLDAGVPIHAGLHVYAHCLRGVPGGLR